MIFHALCLSGNCGFERGDVVIQIRKEVRRHFMRNELRRQRRGVGRKCARDVEQVLIVVSAGQAKLLLDARYFVSHSFGGARNSLEIFAQRGARGCPTLRR